MTPPCYTFPAADLADRVQVDVHGRQRKPPHSDSTASTTANGRPFGVDLAQDCTLLASMVQYSCAVAHPRQQDSPVRCWPVQRLFRRCQDRSGSFMVETTAWEGSEQQLHVDNSSSSRNNNNNDNNKNGDSSTQEPQVSA